MYVHLRLLFAQRYEHKTSHRAYFSDPPELHTALRPFARPTRLPRGQRRRCELRPRLRLFVWPTAASLVWRGRVSWCGGRRPEGVGPPGGPRGAARGGAPAERAPRSRRSCVSREAAARAWGSCSMRFWCISALRSCGHVSVSRSVGLLFRWSNFSEIVKSFCFFDYLSVLRTFYCGYEKRSSWRG